MKIIWVFFKRWCFILVFGFSYCHVEVFKIYYKVWENCEGLISFMKQYFFLYIQKNITKGGWPKTIAVVNRWELSIGYYSDVEKEILLNCKQPNQPQNFLKFFKVSNVDRISIYLYREAATIYQKIPNVKRFVELIQKIEKATKPLLFFILVGETSVNCRVGSGFYGLQFSDNEFNIKAITECLQKFENTSQNSNSTYEFSCNFFYPGQGNKYQTGCVESREIE